MGRTPFSRFLTPAVSGSTASGRDPGVYWGAEFASWDDLLSEGRRRAALLRCGTTYAVNPEGGPMASLASLLAVASVPDTTLLWASPKRLGLTVRESAPEVFEVTGGASLPASSDRPLWGICTSGSTGTPKVAIGHADEWELIALHSEAAMYQDAIGGRPPTALATCLPLGFSAAFFMSVLPALFFRRDLLIFPPHDWRPLTGLAQRHRVAALGVPALAAAACINAIEPAAMDSVALFLGGGHLSGERVRLIREHFTGIRVSNLYGTAETGAIALDHDPGHNEHVGFPIAGKSVWIRNPDERGTGEVCVTGPGCAQYQWRPGQAPTPTAGLVSGTDYGRFDSAGHLCLEGRPDGGEKLAGVLVYPRAVERHLLTLDGVSDARVTVEHPSSGLEHLAATVVGEVDPPAVEEHCTQLPEHQRPSRIRYVSEGEAASVYTAHGKL
ncbi:AMP-binding protein [Streptomyces verrucosisporus]|uniref:AMP-binding protein n=1 Tax=Streptomyces verrucosisporus TaxID=1695161 RepID=UPI0019D23AFC|nr:AMP-binding protein [Streptomyces verrucosisporus]MBN3932622.1 AMP-binding protein [Streptomyces verrucosisporus]